MNEYAKMVEQAETENEKIFWKRLSEFLVGDAKVTIEKTGTIGKMIHLDGVPFVIFFDFTSKDVMEAYAYAAAQATNVISIVKLVLLKEMIEHKGMIEDDAEEQRESK